ncbi:ABC transporter ATP-binding protein [Fulvivirga sp. RKSG066]|uniref:ABC transporter ATP-binding protein n=1 Tax=Fulvivirga aurantia TaxID=2529383 RepID=UPI0012BC745B|nr:ABC transporter ATP-binding protein [Fulvivirga aurantia]MTI21431.1 ABC transporter ATP-binding protein [Fulvivirga aurantia]
MIRADHDITLSLDNLTVGYFKGKSINRVIENIHLKAYSGELICFMGPNGVGKSTLLRTVCSLQKPIEGNINIRETNLNDISPSQLAKEISLVLTEQINAGNLNAYELVALGRYPYLGWNIKINTEDQQIIDRSIAQTGIEKFVHKKVFELSDGQLQKVMIARALAQDTPILILDEPTAHLDLNNRVAIVNLLKDLAKDANKTIIMATHELDLALQTADKLWLAGEKQPIREDIPEDLVLNGAIDEVFKLKGYDLKTGTLEKKSLGYKVHLMGDGHNFLWTKNALERNGFDLDENAEIRIEIKNGGNLSWHLKNEDTTHDTLNDLIIHLIKLFQ